QVVVITLSPNIGLVTELNELRGNSHVIANSAYASREDILHTQLTTDLIHGFVMVLVVDNRATGDHSQPLRVQLTKPCNHLFGHSIAEVLLFWVTAEVFKGQHRQHDFLFQWCGLPQQSRAAKISEGQQDKHEQETGPVDNSKPARSWSLGDRFGASSRRTTGG